MGSEFHRQAVEDAMEEAFGRDSFLTTGSDGYELTIHPEHRLSISLRDGCEPAVLATTTLVSQVSESWDLLRELNDFNRTAEFCRAYWADRTIFVEAELTLNHFNATVLVEATERLNQVIDRLTPVLSMYFGTD